MGTTDDRPPPDESALQAGPPDLVRVGRRDGWRPAVAVVAAAALLFAIAIWKPWEPGAGPATALSALPSGAAVALPPAITSRADGPAAPTPVAAQRAPTFAGLDLSRMGTVDPHVAWGVALGSVSQEQFAAAAQTAPMVTPTADWQLVEPGQASPGPVLDRPGVTGVAIAATWPALPTAMRPLSLRLFRFWHTDRGPLSGPASSPVAGVEVRLETTLDDVVGSGADAHPVASPGSGRFFIPPALSEDVVAWPNTGWPESWPDHGWPAGLYEFQVVLADGDIVDLPFVIASGRTP